MASTPATIGERIGAARHRLDCSVNDLAAVTGIGDIADIEHDRRQPDSTETAVLADALDVGTRWLLGIQPTNPAQTAAARLEELRTGLDGALDDDQRAALRVVVCRRHAT